MKNILLILIFIMTSASVKLYSQWERVANYNVGSTGQIAVHGSTVFLYGYEKQQFVYRSSDNGTTWENIAFKFPDKVYYIHGHGSEVFAIVGINGIYSSADDGLSWNSKPSVPLADGAVLSLVSDGSILYAVSNRNSVFKSADNGASWNKIAINYSQAQVLAFDFAAAGNKMVLTALNLGAFVSFDGGNNWTLKNPKFIISSVNAFNNEIFGCTYGMYKFSKDTGWASITSGFPNGIGVSASTRSITSIENKLFACYTDVFAGSKIFVSENEGNNWSELGNNLTPSSSSSLNDFIAATPQYLYYYVYAIFDPSANGIYRYQIQSSTAVDDNKDNLPNPFQLEQNYPNPFNPSTVINYKIPKDGQVTLNVYDILGREVKSLVNGFQTAGRHSAVFDASNLSSGTYICRITSGGYEKSMKMLILK